MGRINREHPMDDWLKSNPDIRAIRVAATATAC